MFDPSVDDVGARHAPGDGPQTGAALVSHPDIAKISFTGSTRAGVAIMENAARHGLKPVDHEIMTLMNKAAVSYQLVLTKADKLKPTEFARIAEKTAEAARTHVAAHPEILETSSTEKRGLEPLGLARHDVVELDVVERALFAQLGEGGHAVGEGLGPEPGIDERGRVGGHGALSS